MDGIIEGANVQEVAEPVVTDNNIEGTTTEEVVETGTAEGAEETTAEQKQSAELNTQFAAARRKAEEEYKSKINGINDEFKRLFGNVVNPVTGKPIENYQDYLQAVEHQQREARNQMLQSKGIDPALIEQMVNSSPAIRQAQQILADNNRVEAQRRLENDLKAVSMIAPEIKSLSDLEKHGSYGTVLTYVNNGLNLVDAFKLANFDALSSRKSEAAKQAAINQAKSKNHMEVTSGVATGTERLTPIPDSVLGTWKQAYPDLTMEQLTKKYNSVM